MDRQKLEVAVAQLSGTPSFVRRSIGRIPADQMKSRFRIVHQFSIHEHVWHLADLESEGFFERIQRVLSEDNPMLTPFEGDDIAAQRNYHSLDLKSGLHKFVEYRARNIEKLNTVTAQQWTRFGTFGSHGPITLGQIVESMLEHDNSHIGEIDHITRELSR